MDRDDAITKALRISSENNKVFPQNRYEWTRQAAVVEMLSPCKDEDDFNLINELFQQLDDNIVDAPQCYDLLCDMAMEIKKNEIEGTNTALCVMRTKNDSDSDGSQAIVNELKVSLKMTGGFKYDYSAVCYEDIEWLYKKKGFKHFIVVDDFIGSGKTVKSRYQYFLNRHLEEATIGFYFLAGMSEGVKFCIDNSIPVHCCKIMTKGISEHYKEDLLQKRISSMRFLESHLGEISGDTKLEDNSFGYGGAEALYCRQFGNIPNSVFPIFWWDKNSDDSNRQSVFTRVQNGY